MQRLFTVDDNVTHPQHVIGRRSSQSVQLMSEDIKRSHLLIPQGPGEAMDL